MIIVDDPPECFKSFQNLLSWVSLVNPPIWSLVSMLFGLDRVQYPD